MIRCAGAAPPPGGWSPALAPLPWPARRPVGPEAQVSDPPSTSTDAPLDVAGDRPAASAPPTRSRSAILAAEMRHRSRWGAPRGGRAGRRPHRSVVSEAGSRVAAAYASWARRHPSSPSCGLAGRAAARGGGGRGRHRSDNRWSWLRRLVPDIGRTVLLWQPAPRPGAHPGPSRPSRTRSWRPSRPLILLCLPVDAERPASSPAVRRTPRRRDRPRPLQRPSARPRGRLRRRRPDSGRARPLLRGLRRAHSGPRGPRVGRARERGAARDPPPRRAG